MPNLWYVYYPGLWLVGLIRTTENLSQNSRRPDRDSNRARPEHKSEGLPLEPTCLGRTK
jgi:hypothetical protein